MTTNERNERMQYFIKEAKEKEATGFKIKCIEWDSIATYPNAALLVAKAMQTMREKLSEEMDDYFDLDELKSNRKTQFEISFEEACVITAEVINTYDEMGSTVRFTYWAGFEDEKMNSDEGVKYETETLAKIVNEVLGR